MAKAKKSLRDHHLDLAAEHERVANDPARSQRERARAATEATTHRRLALFARLGVGGSL